MTTKKDAVQSEVEAQVVNATALAIRGDVSGVSQDVLKDEIYAGHLRNMGLDAIHIRIDKDRDELEQQLEEIRKEAQSAGEALSAAARQRDKEIEKFKQKLVHTELRRKRANNLKILNSMPDLSKEYAITDSSNDEYEGFSLKYVEPDPEAEDKLARAGYVDWVYKFETKNRSYGALVSIGGRRGLSARVTTCLNKVQEINDYLNALVRTNEQVRMEMQKLEQKRRRYERELRESVVNNSVVAKDLSTMLDKVHEPVKKLAMPKKYSK